MDLTGIDRTFFPKIEEYTFFSATHSTFSKADHILGQKTDLCRYKEMEIISFTLSDHHGLRLVFNKKKKTKNKKTHRK